MRCTFHRFIVSFFADAAFIRTTGAKILSGSHDAGYADRIVHLFDGHVLGEEETNKLAGLSV